MIINYKTSLVLGFSIRTVGIYFLDKYVCIYVIIKGFIRFDDRLISPAVVI